MTTEEHVPYSPAWAAEVERRVLMPTYARSPVVFVRGEGCRLYDSEGRRYLDFVAGIATVSLGHAHPEIQEVVCRQAGELVHTSNLYYTVPQLLLAEHLRELCGFGKAFFASSGAEAVECALKLVRRYWHRRDPSRRKIFALENSFHGRTMGALSVTGQPSKRQPFEPLVGEVDFLGPADISSLESSLAGAAAVVVELVQGEGGVRPISGEFVEALGSALEATGTLLVVDEVQTGLCRTGAWFAFQHENWSALRPDVVTLGKALGNGFPISACVARDEVADAFEPGDHATTLGGAPVMAAVGRKVLEVMEREGLAGRAARAGRELKAALSSLDGVKGVRGEGLLLGIEVGASARQVASAALRKGLLVNAMSKSTVRICPPLCLSDAELEEGLTILADCMTNDGCAG